MIALRDGREPPTELPKPAPPVARSTSGSGRSVPASAPSAGLAASASAVAGSDGGGGGGGGEESYYDREMRLRREAEERLRAKFGSGGLKGQSVSNSGGMGYTPPEAAAPECVLRLLTCCMLCAGCLASWVRPAVVGRGLGRSRVRGALFSIQCVLLAVCCVRRLLRTAVPAFGRWRLDCEGVAA
jgi:hypothetical protein